MDISPYYNYNYQSDYHITTKVHNVLMDIAMWKLADSMIS